jgi:hypothetical protein
MGYKNIDNVHKQTDKHHTARLIALAEKKECMQNGEQEHN